jgi:hypothetical protein
VSHREAILPAHCLDAHNASIAIGLRDRIGAAYRDGTGLWVSRDRRGSPAIAGRRLTAECTVRGRVCECRLHSTKLRGSKLWKLRLALSLSPSPIYRWKRQ